MDNMGDTNDTQDYIVDDLQNSGTFGSQAAAGHGYLANTAWINFEKVAEDCDIDWSVLEQGFQITRDYQVGLACINVGASLAGGSISSGGEAIGYNGEGGVLSNIPMVNAVVGGITTAASTGMMITNEQSMKPIQQQAINGKVSNARTQSSKLLDNQKYYGLHVKDANNDLRESIVTRFSDTYANDGINNVNANRTKTATDKNSEDLKDTNNANAVRTQTTETNNADYLRDANVLNAKANLRQAQLEVANVYKNAKLQTPYQRGEYDGDFNQDVYERRGIRFNIRTQSKAAIKQAGDAFLRFGYALHRVWDMSNGFHYGKHFTFWKAEDVWINDGSGLAGNSVNIIRDILMSGTTVWKDPDEIGTLSIYDNI